LLLLPIAANPGISATTGRVQDDDAYDTELQKGSELLRRRNYEEALKSFKRANEMRGKKSPECFFGMAQAYFGLEAFKSAVESCVSTMRSRST
jgi:tetratricopeptide (TPR) repeat protein